MQPVPGLYESVPLASFLKVGDLKLYSAQEAVKGSPETARLNSWIMRGNRDLGSALRFLDRGRMSLELSGLFLQVWDERKISCPQFLRVKGTMDLVPGRGIPTSSFLTLWQLKLAGVEFGQLRFLNAYHLENPVTVLEMHQNPRLAGWLMLKWPEAPPSEILRDPFLASNSGRYISTLLGQLGVRVKDIKVSAGDTLPCEEFASEYSIDSRRFKGLTANLRATDRIIDSYAVEIELEPY